MGLATEAQSSRKIRIIRTRFPPPPPFFKGSVALRSESLASDPRNAVVLHNRVQLRRWEARKEFSFLLGESHLP